jgi:hypothetical protein
MAEWALRARLGEATGGCGTALSETGIWKPLDDRVAASRHMLLDGERNEGDVLAFRSRSSALSVKARFLCPISGPRFAALKSGAAAPPRRRTGGAVVVEELEEELEEELKEHTRGGAVFAVLVGV